MRNWRQDRTGVEGGSISAARVSAPDRGGQLSREGAAFPEVGVDERRLYGRGDEAREDEVERGAPRDVNIVFAMIPVFAIIGAVLAILAAVMPAWRAGLALAIPALIVLIVGAFLASRHRNRAG